MYSYLMQKRPIRSAISRPGVGAGLGLVAMLLGLVSLGRADANDSLDREVDHVYVRAGDVQYRLPELMAQLEVRAVLELGRLKEPRSGGRFEPTEDYPYYEPDPPPPEQTVKAFEFPEGTVKGALDAYCSLNPHLEWRQTNGIVWVRRRAGSGPMLKKILAFRLDKYPPSPQDLESESDGAPLVREHLYELAKRVNTELGHQVLGFRTVSLGYHEPGSAERFPTHEYLGSRAAFQREDASVKEILLEVMEPFPNIVVQLTSNGRTCGASLLSWAQMRRKLNLNELASAYTLQPKPLFGCANVTMRRDSALRELRRRYHFEPEKVVEALIEQGTVEALAQPMRPNGAIPLTTLTVGGLFRMNDAGLSKHATEVILKLPDPVARYHFVSGSMPRPYQPGFDLVLPVWKQLVHDEDADIRTLAQMILDWHEKRPARLKSVEEPGGGGS